MKVGKIVLWAAVMLVSGAAHATPGGLDAAGCHHSKKIGYHCHPERVGKATRAATVPTVTAEDRRLKRECKGRPNAGACLGYAR